jgi:hypothetical protein
MAEGLAAIGLVGNIIQFITFGAALVSKSREIHQSASGISNELVDLDLVSKDIKLFSSQLSNNVHAYTQLSDIAKSCKAVADDLQRAEKKIKQRNLSSNTGRSKWRSFRKALKCVWERERIEELKCRLVLLRDQVSLRVLANTK